MFVTMAVCGARVLSIANNLREVAKLAKLLSAGRTGIMGFKQAN